MGAFYSFFKTISRKSILVYFYIAIICYQVIEVYRDSDERTLNSLIEVVDKKYFNTDSGLDSEKDFFSEENSLFTTTVGVRGTFFLIPNKDTFSLGYYQFVGVVGVIPFVKGIILSENDLATTSSYLTYYLKGKNSPMGIGTNIISDLYIDFGLPGVLIGMFFLGRYIVFIERKIRDTNYSILWFCIYFVSFATIAEMPRYNYSFPLRNCIWVLVVIYIFEYLYRKNLKFNKIKNSDD